MIIETEYLYNKVNLYLDSIIQEKEFKNKVDTNNNFTNINKSLLLNSANIKNNNMIFFKSYLKKDESNCFTIVDIKNSIKCLFNKEYLSEYLNQYPSYISLNNFDGTLIYVKKCYYDILFNKEGEEKINSKVILIIEDFDLDQAQKMSNELYNQKYLDINLNPDIEDKLDDIYYNMIKEKTDIDRTAHENINEHLKIDFDMFFDNKNFGGINKNIISSEINISPKDKIAWFYSETNINNFKELSNEEDIMNVHEIQLKNNDNNNNLNNSENINNNNEKNNHNNKIEITEDKLKNLGFKNLLGGNIIMKNKNKIVNGFDLLNKKRERDNYIKKIYKNGNNDIEEEKTIMENGKYNNGNIYIEQNKQKKYNGGEFEQNKKYSNSLPIVIQNLMVKMKKKEPITFNIFEKYKTYKKLNSNEYKKEKTIK
jgi:hypothetical protein